MKKYIKRMFALCMFMVLTITGIGSSNIEAQAEQWSEVSLDKVEKVESSAQTTEKQPKSITLNAKSRTMTVGSSFNLKVKKVTPTSASKAVVFRSSNTKVAKVSTKGKVTAKKAGSATITVFSKSCKTVKATCKIKVYSKVKSVRISKKNPVLSVGEKLDLKASVLPSTAKQGVKYKSNNSKVVSVSSKGILTAKKAGTATVRITSTASTKIYAECKVTVQSTYDKSVLSTLKNTEHFLPSAIEHIFEGQINSSGNATGYHYEGIKNSAGKVVEGTRTTPNELGIYEAKVTVNGVAKASNGGYSTFYPQSYSPQQVVDAINEAYNNKQYIRDNIYMGSSKAGIDISMYLTDDGMIISAFPIE